MVELTVDRSPGECGAALSTLVPRLDEALALMRRGWQAIEIGARDDVVAPAAHAAGREWVLVGHRLREGTELLGRAACSAQENYDLAEMAAVALWEPR